MKKINIVLFFYFIILISTNVSSLTCSPPPIIDITGVIIDLENVPITQSVNISLINLDTNITTLLSTNRNNPSHFKISVSGCYIVDSNGITTDSESAMLIVNNREYNVNLSIFPLGIISNISIPINMNFKDNYAPEFYSVPKTTAVEGEEYIYNINVEDYNQNDTITLSLQNSPSNMELINNIISWTPNQYDVNLTSYKINITATDNHGLTSYQNYTLTISNVNNAPIIISEPIFTAKEGFNYSYQILAIDEDNDDMNNLSYKIIQGPTGLTINQTSGLVFWNTHIGDKKSYPVILNVSDKNISVIQEFILFVNPTSNQEPIITSSASKNAALNKEYTYGITAIDNDNDELFYEILNPPGESYMEGNVFHWIPSQEDYETKTFRFIARVVDIKESTACQIFYVNVTNSTIENEDNNNNNLENKNNKIIQKNYIIQNNKIEIYSNTTKKIMGLLISTNNISSVFSYNLNGIVNELIINYKQNINEPVFYVELQTRPTILESPSLPVYQYFSIFLENQSNDLINSTIIFTVKNEFLQKINITYEDMVFLSYSNNSWNQLNLKIKEKLNDSIVFYASINELGYFAIVSKIQQPISTSVYKSSPSYNIKEFINLSGIVYSKSRFFQLEKMTKYRIIIRGKTDEYRGFTGLYNEKYSGSFFNLIEAEIGDRVIIEILDNNNNILYSQEFTINNEKSMNIKVYTNISPKIHWNLIVQVMVVILFISFLAYQLELFLFRRNK